MKKRVIKLIVAVLVLMALCVPFVAHAEDIPPVDVTTTTPDNTTPPEDVVAPPASDVDGKFSWEEVKETFSTTIMIWVQEHAEEIGVIVTLIGYGFTLFKRLKSNDKKVVTLNNNAIAIAKESTACVEKAMESIEAVTLVVDEYKIKMDKLLEAYNISEDARKKLETELIETKEYLRVDSMANLEFATMFEELLALANIPNYKKQEMGERHIARVTEIKKAIEHAEHVTDEMVNAGEVKENVREEA